MVSCCQFTGGVVTFLFVKNRVCVCAVFAMYMQIARYT